MSAEDVARLERALAEISSSLAARDTQCAQRGERLATLEEHDRATNGYLRRIEESITRIEGSVQETRDAVSLAKGIWTVAALVVGSAIAWAVQFLPAAQ